MRSATLHFLCGKAGAGKSTLARRLADEDAALLISEDIWLGRLFGDQMKTFDEYLRVCGKLKTVVGPLVVDLLRSGQTVVLDFPANTKAGRLWYRSLFEQASAGHILHFAEASDALCWARIEQRNVERPEGSHHLSKEVFQHVSSFFEAPDEAEGFSIQRYSAA